MQAGVGVYLLDLPAAGQVSLAASLYDASHRNVMQRVCCDVTTQISYAIKLNALS